jgi:ornithine cyclodeaminase
MAEAGDLLIPIQEGAITADHIVAELGEVVAGKQPGRRSPEEITLFKSLGLAIEDVVAAGFVARHATQTRRGRSVAW